MEKRQATKRRGLLIAAAVAAFLVFAIAYSVLSSDDGNSDVAAGDSTTTTTPGDTAAGETTTVPAADAEPLPCPPKDGAEERVTDFPAPPPDCLEDGVDYVATMETDAGTITIDLAEDKAPKTVNNFVYLARYKYYDGITFHRVIPDFVIQGGDPTGTGTGGPGYSFEDELPQPDEYQAGSLAMANSGPNTNGSQFFIVTSDTGAKTLVDAVGGEAKYSLFGQVTEGMDVVQAIEADGSPGGTPATVHTITSVTIQER